MAVIDARGYIVTNEHVVAGDWLRGVNHRALRTPADFLAVLAALRPGADAVFTIQRGPYVWYVPLRL